MKFFRSVATVIEVKIGQKMVPRKFPLFFIIFWYGCSRMVAR